MIELELTEFYKLASPKRKKKYVIKNWIAIMGIFAKIRCFLGR